jgi:hypothetical protein
VLVIGGGIALIVRQASYDAYNDDRRCSYGGLTREERCGSYRGVALTAEGFAIAQFGVATAAAAASATLFIVTSHRNDRQKLGCHLGAMLTCGAAF